MAFFAIALLSKINLTHPDVCISSALAMGDGEGPVGVDCAS